MKSIPIVFCHIRICIINKKNQLSGNFTSFRFQFSCYFQDIVICISNFFFIIYSIYLKIIFSKWRLIIFQLFLKVNSGIWRINF